jgi:hypothetical protein
MISADEGEDAVLDLVDVLIFVHVDLVKVLCHSVGKGGGGTVGILQQRQHEFGHIREFVNAALPLFLGIAPIKELKQLPESAAKLGGRQHLLLRLLGSAEQIAFGKLLNGVEGLGAQILEALGDLALFLFGQPRNGLEFQICEGGIGVGVALFQSRKEAATATHIVLKIGDVFFL